MVDFKKDFKEVKLDSIIDGEMSDLFEAELQKVIANIFDENTDSKKTRSIIFHIRFLPGEERQNVMYYVEIKSKLAPKLAAGSQLVMVKEKNQYFAFETNFKQIEMEKEDSNREVRLIKTK